MGLRIYNGGTYDLFHWGHVKMLEQLKQLAGDDGALIIALNTDEFVEKFKGKRPIMNLWERFDVVASCKYVDEVVVNEFDGDSKPTILATRAQFVITGTDWAEKDYMKQMGFTREWLESNKIGFGFLPYTGGISTTQIRERLRFGKLEA